MYRAIQLAPAVAMLLGWSPSLGADLDGIRGPTPLTADSAVPPVSKDIADEQLRARFSHDQPPVIPHPVSNYRLDASANDCLSCHSRTRTAQSPASPISIAHFTDRDGRVSGALTPGRYFCTQCHVPQTEATPPLGNTYQVLTIVWHRRYLCMGCHLPQRGITSPTSTTSRDRDDHAR